MGLPTIVQARKASQYWIYTFNKLCFPSHFEQQPQPRQQWLQRDLTWNSEATSPKSKQNSDQMLHEDQTRPETQKMQRKKTDIKKQDVNSLSYETEHVYHKS